MKVDSAEREREKCKYQLTGPQQGDNLAGTTGIRSPA
jgi:hypothetical protein